MNKKIDMKKVRKCHEIWDEEVKSANRSHFWSNLGKGAFIGLLVIISIVFILGWVIV